MTLTQTPAEYEAMLSKHWNYDAFPMDDDAIHSIAACASDTGATDINHAWPEPTPIPDALPAVEPFDAELLPVALRAWVMDIAHRMQCPADFPAVAVLVALSSLIGARAVIQPKARDDWQVVPNLWGAVVGRPGVKKSPALGEALRPLHRLEVADFELWQAAHEAWALDRKVTAMQDDANERKAKGLATKDPAAARALLQLMDTPAEPTARRYIVNDATVEKLGELMQQNAWGTLSYRDELYGLLTSLDKPGQEGARAFMLQSYDGNQGYTFDRIGRGTVYIPRVCLAMIGGIQPGRIQEYVRAAVAGGSADDGLLQRFGLTVWPDVTGDFVHVDQWPDTPAKQAAWAVFERLAQLQPASDTSPVIWRFSPEAQDLFVEWLVPFEVEIRSDELHPAMVSHLAKYRKLIPALALVFALIDTPDSGGIVHEGELLRALAMGDYLRSHANRLYAAAVTPETTGAAALLSKIRVGKWLDRDGVMLDSFAPREVAVKHWAGLTTPEAVRKAADVLVDYDYLRRDVALAGAAGGRPSDRYVINPALLTGGAV
jgi:putative DNA primase/helicase